MHIEEKLIFIDLEAVGHDPEQHPIMQLAAVAVDSSIREVETFESKIHFDETMADAKSLSANRYSREVWEREAVSAWTAAGRFSRFLRRHATFDMISKDGRLYQVAQLAAHNGECFDGPFLHAWYRKLGLFCPARYMVLCTKQRALWLFDENKSLTPPADFKLGTLCEYFGVRLPTEDAHDAFNDVRATVELYRKMTRTEMTQRAA